MELGITLWGDSVMRGVIWNNQLGKYKLLPENAAESASKKLGIRLSNRSKMGCTSSKGLTILKQDLDKGISSQIALLEFGGNDCDFQWAEIADQPDGIHLPNTPPDLFRKKMEEMVALLRENHLSPILTTLVPNHPQRYFDFFTRNGLNKENILHWLGDVGHIYRWHERYNSLLVSVAMETGCPLIDLREAFLSQWHYEDYLCEDGIHPNEKGHQLIQEVLVQEGSRLLLANGPSLSF